MIGLIILVVYAAIFIGSFLLIGYLVRSSTKDFTSLKTVTFGDESAVRPNRWASVISVLTILLIWGSFTGSKYIPSFLHAPAPFVGETSFVYTVEDANGDRDDATVFVRIAPLGEKKEKFSVEPGEGMAKDDALAMIASRSETLLFDKNDDSKRKDGAKIVAIDGETLTAGEAIRTSAGRFSLSSKGAIVFKPPSGLQMDPLYLPPPESVVSRFMEIATEGYRGYLLHEHLGISLFRVIAGFFFGALLGIPLGYAMGLANWPRGWFDPIVEFMRPVPPLALIPLMIIWFGIDEESKIILLFLAAFWIMIIAARSGVSGVNITKVHAAYSLGASKPQILRQVIVPNSLPEIFTGARVAMGVCWGTVVAAELVSGVNGAGFMIMAASKFQQTDIVLLGIILIGAIGFGIDTLMRLAERKLVPWKGRS